MTDKHDTEKPAREPVETEAAETPDSQSVDWEDPATWPREIGGRRGPEPTRYGDWESNGRCSDF